MFGFEHDDAMRSNLRRFRVVKVDDKGTQQRVDLSGMKKELPTKVWRPMPHGFTSNPPKDSDGYMIGMGGRSDRMLYVDGGHEKYRPRDLPEGAMALYNHSGDIIRLFENNFDIVHARKVTVKIGKGQDVSRDDGSKPPEGDEKDISIVLDGDSMTLTFGGSSIKLADGKVTVKADNILLDGAVDLGGEGGLPVDRTDDNPSAKVKAL